MSRKPEKKFSCSFDLYVKYGKANQFLNITYMIIYDDTFAALRPAGGIGVGSLSKSTSLLLYFRAVISCYCTFKLTRTVSCNVSIAFKLGTRD